MFEDLNRELAEVNDKIRTKSKLEADLERVKESLIREKSRIVELQDIMNREGRDVDRLEGLSLAGIFYSILGSKDEQLDKERQEYLSAKLNYDKSVEAAAVLQKEAEELAGRIAGIGDVEARYNEIMKKKEKFISESKDENAKRLLELTEEISNLRADLREVGEAVYAGRDALRALYDTASQLESAEGWGTWDMFGGGTISTMMKHSRIDDARSSAQEAQYILERFQRELEDVEGVPLSNLDIQIGSFETFADYFFDNLITDWVVQSKIRNSLSSTSEVTGHVENIVSRLEMRYRELETKISELEIKRKEFIERA